DTNTTRCTTPTGRLGKPRTKSDDGRSGESRLRIPIRVPRRIRTSPSIRHPGPLTNCSRRPYESPPDRIFRSGRRKRVMKSLLLTSVSFGVLLAVLLGAAASAWAQASTGGLRGVVKDESGGVLVGVTVEAESPARIGGAAVEVTDAEGTYRFENLPL